MKWGVWIRENLPPFDYGMRTVEEAESAEDACRIVRRELDGGKNGVTGVLSSIMGAKPYDEALLINDETTLRKAFGWPTHLCDVCESWFVEPHVHTLEGVPA